MVTLRNCSLPWWCREWLRGDLKQQTKVNSLWSESATHCLYLEPGHGKELQGFKGEREIRFHFTWLAPRVITNTDGLEDTRGMERGPLRS